MTDLQGAMKNVDAQEREDRVGGAGAVFRSATPPTLRAVAGKDAPDDDAKAVAKAGDAAEFYFEKANSVRAIARTAVALAADIAGQDARNHRTLDVATTDAVEKLLLNLLAADKADLPPGFKALSSAAAFRKASDVSKALDAEGGQP